MNHSILMLINNRGFKKNNDNKLLKILSLFVVIMNIIAVISLLVRGMGGIENVFLNISFISTFVVGVIMLVIRVSYSKKSKNIVKKQSKRK